VWNVEGVKGEISFDSFRHPDFQAAGTAVACTVVPGLSVLVSLATEGPGRLDMNINEAAKYLFVSRPHVRQLLERGKITGTPSENGDYVIDDASVVKYAADRKRAAKEWLDSQTEDNDPLGL
jgi:excisionase family DNA binding protein